MPEITKADLPDKIASWIADKCPDCNNLVGVLSNISIGIKSNPIVYETFFNLNPKTDIETFFKCNICGYTLLYIKFDISRLWINSATKTFDDDDIESYIVNREG